MSLAHLVLWQLVLDVVLIVAVIALIPRRRAVRRAPAPPPPPPAWFGELVELAQDLMVATDRVSGSLEARRAASADEPSARGERPEPPRDPWTLVRAGLAPEEAARRGGLPAAELRLLRSVVAAAAEPPSA
jgi:hypothetical protein